MPSEANDRQWEIIWYDVTYQLKLKLSQLSMHHLQIYNTLIEVAAGIFGDGKDKPEPVKINDLPPDLAVAKMNEVFKAAGAG